MFKIILKGILFTGLWLIICSNPIYAQADSTGSWETIFFSGFEADEGTLISDSLWSNAQIQEPSGAPESFITFDSTIVRSSARSIKMFAPHRQFDSLRNEDFCGKASIQTRNFVYNEGETYRFSAWFYLTDPPEIANFLMIDIECGVNECEFEGGPGIRVMILKQTDRLITEWKFLNWFNDVIKPDVPPGNPVPGIHSIPVHEWFKVTYEVTLGVGEAGITRIYVNDELDSEVIGTNIRPGGVLSTMDRYTSFELGLTCNIGTQPTTIYVDDAQIEHLNEIPVSTDDPPVIPDKIKLFQNYPNPFNPGTSISFQLPNPGHVQIDIFTITGRKIATLLNNQMSPGKHQIQFDASAFSSGTYLYRLRSNNFSSVKKMILIK